MSKTNLRAGILLLSVAFFVSPLQAQVDPEEGLGLTSTEEGEEMKLSGRQMVDRTEEHLDQMRQMLKDVLEILEDARSEKDVVKLNCTNEKLTQIKGLLRVSEQASIALQEWSAKDQIEDARHEYRKVSIAREKVQQLRAEAEECIGQLAFYIDEDMTVNVEVPEDLPDDDPRIDPIPPILVRPSPVSPTG
ncbi:MAG: hypothetical protein P1V51_21335 [Deltaproteobacteria bacterium]|nr:hypothetical protein [Deltaproteobacteria bacterium]